MRRTFLFVLWDGGGNVEPQLVVGRRLVERGHAVAVLAPRVLERRIVASGCRFVPYRRAPDHDSRSPEGDLLRDWEARSTAEVVAQLLDRLTIGPAEAFLADVLSEIEARPVDAIASDFLIFGPLLAAELTGLPTAAVFHQIYTRPTPGAPIVGTGEFPPETAAERRALLRRAQRYERLFDRHLPAFNSLRARFGLSALPHLFDALDRADRAFVLTASAFDFPNDRRPANVRYLGPQLGDPDWQERWISPWPLDTPEPLVAASFSTTYQDQSRVVERVLEAVRTLPVRALVTTGQAVERSAFHPPENVILQDFAPHRQVFAHARAVVTHAGHGTVMAALAAGVPLLCLPMGRDQPDNAARVVRSGAGLRLDPEASIEALRAALLSLLSDSGYRIAASRMAELFAAEGAAERAVAAYEDLAG